MNTDNRDDPAYRAIYDEAAGRLRGLAQGLAQRLDPHDVAGLFTATGLAVLLDCEPDVRTCEWLRRYADEVERERNITPSIGRS